MFQNRLFVPLIITFAALWLGIASSNPMALSLNARISKSKVIRGEPIFVDIELRNDEHESVTIPSKLSFLSQFLWITVSKGGEQAIPYIGVVVDFSLVSHAKVELKAGESEKVRVNLLSSYAIVDNGQYQITVAYKGRKEQYRNPRGNLVEGVWEGEVKAPLLVVEVKAPHGIDKDAYDYFFDKRKSMEVVAAKERKAKGYSNNTPPSDDEIKARLGQDFWQDASELVEKFPSSIYTAHALYTKFNLDKKRVAFDPRVKALAKNHELIVRYHPDFVFIDEVYETLGNYYRQEGNPAGAREMFEKALEATKNAERKVRVGGFLKALESLEQRKTVKS